MNLHILKEALEAAWPIMGGYVVLGLPCGLLCQQAGLDWIQVLLMSALFYSGAGQYMIPNMWLAGNPLLSIVLSVNTRQMLYSASLARYCHDASRPLAFLFAATVTDESFGVNLARFEKGGWDTWHATLVNLCSQSTWALSCVAGCLVGGLLSVPTALASFAMTAIFICLLCMQKPSAAGAVAALCAAAGVFLCKLAGLAGPAVLVGALVGLGCGLAVLRIRGGAGATGEPDADAGKGVEETPAEGERHTPDEDAVRTAGEGGKDASAESGARPARGGAL